MQKDRWARKIDWVTYDSGITYTQIVRSVEYEEDRFIAVGDIYFKLNKYLSGVTFTYINNLNDIYKIDMLTGDGKSLVNMYNEYDIIDDVLRNLYIVDVASNSNININKQCVIIDGVSVKSGHLVLLKDQDKKSENDVYIVNNNNFLENYKLLSSREKSYKFSCSVKLGTNSDKQFFLDTIKTTSGEYFPIYFEQKSFIEGQSYLLKHFINYNIYNTYVGDISSGATTSRMIFTDYDLARKQVDDNYALYSNFDISLVINDIPLNFVTINYHNEVYCIRYGLMNEIIYTGQTLNIINDNNGTKVYYDDNFDVIDNDYLRVTLFSGNTENLTFKSYVKDVDSINNFFYLETKIPNNILTNLKNTNYKLINYSVSNNWDDALYKFQNNPYSEFFDVEYKKSLNLFYDVNVKPKESKYNKYFDYDGITFYLTDNNDFRKFDTDNQYVKYKLFDRLNEIDNVIFNSNFSFFNEYLLDDISSYRYINSDTIKIFTDVEDLQDKFKPYTYVYASNSSGQTELTWVQSVSDYEIIIERPKNWIQYPLQRQEPPVVSIKNVDGLKNISDILYDVYINELYEGGWYNYRSDNERKKICNIYAKLLTENSGFTDNITGIIYEEENEFILKLYDIINDKNLYYSPVELIFVGSDKITRLPVPFNISGVTTTTTTIRRPIIPGVIPTTTTTTTTALPITTTTTTTVAPPTTTTTTTVDCTMEGEVNCNYILKCTLLGIIECSITTTTTTAPIDCIMEGEINCNITTTTTTLPPTTTTTTTILLADIYYGVSSNSIVTPNEILTEFNTAVGNIGTVDGRLYRFDGGYYYKYWAIPDLPNTGDRVVNNITNLNNNVSLVYDQYYRYYQENPYTDEQQSITYGKITINGIVYRIYRSILKSNSQLDCYVYSIV